MEVRNFPKSTCTENPLENGFLSNSHTATHCLAEGVYGNTVISDTLVPWMPRTSQAASTRFSVIALRNRAASPPLTAR